MKSLSCAVFCSLFLAASAHSQSTFNVANSNDTGAGSLRQAVTDSNAAGGANAIDWIAGSGGTITLATDLPGISTSTTLDVTNAPSSVTVTGAGAVPLAGPVAFNNNNVLQPWTISAVISGSGSLIQTGAGTLILTGANTYGGGTFLDGGILNINGDAALGAASSTVTFVTGTLQAGANISSARNIVLALSGTFDTNGNTSALSGVISGGGTLNVTGAGELDLNGVNTYTGGTVVSTATVVISSDAALGNGGQLTLQSGATLRTAAGFGIASTRGVTLGTGGGIFDTNGSSSTLAGSIGGGGSLTKIGTNTLFLTGVNSYGGGTFLNAGTVNIGNGSALGSGVVTFNGGTLQAGAVALANGLPMTVNAPGGTIDANGNNLALSGAITGAGALTIESTANSTGTVVLTGANSFTGLNLDSGVLNFNGDGALGISTATVVFNGGTLQAGAANIVSPRAMTINAGGGTFDTNGFDVLLSSTIAGAGSLTKIGLGNLALSGSNTYAGGTIISSGAVVLASTDSLPTAGALTVGSQGTFDMGTFTQTLASYGGGGTLKMILRKGVTDLNVSGAADFTNGTLVVALAPQIVLAGDTFTPITYGSHTSTFAIVSPPLFALAPTYNAGSLVLTASFVPFAASAANPNQAAVGGALEPFRGSPTGGMAGVIATLYSLDLPHLRAALDQIGPVSYGVMQGVALSGAQAQATAVQRRIAALSRGAQTGGLSFYRAGSGSRPEGPLLASVGIDDTASAGDGGDARTDSPWGLFASGVLDTGRLAEANSDAGLQPGFAFNTQGVTAGADYRFNEFLTAGAALGYLHGHASVYSPQSGTVDNQGPRYGVYAVGTDGDLHGDLYVGGALDYFSTTRDIPALSQTATASPRGTEFNTNADASYDFHLPGKKRISPFLGLSYNRLRVGSFTESGAAADLDVSPQTAESLQSGLGLRYSMDFQADDYTASPYVSLGWRHEFDNQSRPITADFAATGSSSFSVATGDFARDGTLTGLGFAVRWTRLSANVDYSGDFRSHYQNHNFNGGVRWKF